MRLNSRSPRIKAVIDCVLILRMPPLRIGTEPLHPIPFRRQIIEIPDIRTRRINSRPPRRLIERNQEINPPLQAQVRRRQNHIAAMTMRNHIQQFFGLKDMSSNHPAEPLSSFHARRIRLASRPLEKINRPTERLGIRKKRIVLTPTAMPLPVCSWNKDRHCGFLSGTGFVSAGLSCAAAGVSPFSLKPTILMLDPNRL